MKITELINRKKYGQEHTKEEIEFIINGVMDKSITDYQLSAWLMAIYFQGMTTTETSYLTESIVKSGDILDLSELGEYIVDKHSTGGVGDKITLILIPLLAAAGIPVAKLSGRSLGHTGGTIDKLESIKDFDTALPIDTFIKQVKEIGVAIGAQTLKLAPADGKLYALRDVTSTVDSMPLIASSVVSKKIAAGANVIVLDVKYGSGAFIKTKEDAEKLSEIMSSVAKKLGRKIVCVITSMEQPLGFAIGNALEVKEAIDVLKGKGPKDTKELTLHLGAISMVGAKKATDIESAKEILKKHINDGSAYAKFEELIKAQGGKLETGLPQAQYKVEIKAKEYGYISKCEAIQIAKAAKLLGAGRDKKEDPIDYSVGVTLNKKLGDKVSKDEVIATLHTKTKSANEAQTMVETAFEISKSKPDVEDLIYKVID